MLAFIFNSGVGRRLGDLTNNTPKGLVALKSGETILGRQLRLLEKAGIKHVVISTGYLSEVIEKHVKNNFKNLTFTFMYNEEYATTNSIKSFDIPKGLQEHNFIIMHGDLIFDENIISTLINDKRKNITCINTKIAQPPKDFKGRVKDGKLQRIAVDIFEAEDYALQPLYKVSSSLLKAWLNEKDKMIQGGEDNVYAENALNKILPLGDMEVFDYYEHYIEEIDTLEDYERVNEDIRRYDFKHQRVFVGDYISNLEEVFKKFNYKRPFIVYSRAVRYDERFKAFIKKYNARLFNGYSPNPKYEEAVQGLKEFKEHNADVIVALGGGSCIDTAKTIKMFASLSEDKPYLEQPFVYSSMPLIVAPTTAGTGSEATRFAVIYKDDVKYSVVHDSLFPNVAILDETFLNNLPDYQRKAALLDAFCQAVEGFWAKASDEESRAYSEKALKIFTKHYKAYVEGSNEYNKEIMEVAYFAGQSINLTTTTAPHAMSYKLTSLTGIAHGHAVSVTLPYVYDYMLEHVDRELSETFSALAKVLNTTKDKLSEELKNIIKYFNLETPSVSEKDLKVLVDAVDITRLSNNPLTLDKEVVSAIYRKALNIKKE